MKQIILTPELLLNELSHEELIEIQNLHFARIFSNRASEAIPITASARAAEPRPWTLRLGLFDKGTLIGWHVGHASDQETYHMRNTVILEGHRNRGNYGALLDGVLDLVRDEGFQVVTSHHHPNNAAVLIPKIRRGFVISSTFSASDFAFSSR